SLRDTPCRCAASRARAGSGAVADDGREPRRSCEHYFVEIARGPPAGCDLRERWRSLFAFFHCVWTAWMKMTARGRRQRRRDLTLDRDELALLGREPSDFGKQGLGVRVIGIGKKFRRRSRFDHAPEIQDKNAVADMANDPEIV